MKILIATVLFAVLAGCYGYSYIIPASLKFPGMCFYNGAMLPAGDSQVAGVCQHTMCNVDGSILIEGCGPISLPNCTLIPDVTPKSYPDCCAMTYQCIGPDGIPYTKEWNQLYPDGSLVQKVTINNESLKQKLMALKKEKQASGDSKVVSPFILQFLLV